MRPPLRHQTLQFSIALQLLRGPLQTRPEVVGVGVFPRILLDGKCVLVAVKCHSQLERVEVAWLLVHPVLGSARVDHESIRSVTFSHLKTNSFRESNLSVILVPETLKVGRYLLELQPKYWESFLKIRLLYIVSENGPCVIKLE